MSYIAYYHKLYLVTNFSCYFRQNKNHRNFSHNSLIANLFRLQQPLYSKNHQNPPNISTRTTIKNHKNHPKPIPSLPSNAYTPTNPSHLIILLYFLEDCFLYYYVCILLYAIFTKPSIFETSFLTSLDL